jgi:hypothetical protein
VDIGARGVEENAARILRLVEGRSRPADPVKPGSRGADFHRVSPITHFLVGWATASTARLERRDRMLVALAGVAPDLDGLGIVVDFATRGSAHPTEWWGSHHHVLGHNLAAAVLISSIVYAAGRRRMMAALLAALSFHLHLLGDVIGSRGPDGYQWPIPYLMPFSDVWQVTWSGQWALNAWPNFALTAALLCLTFCPAWRRGHSPLEMISTSADEAFVTTLRRRFGTPEVAALR